jgi:hypothetical protein
MTFFYNFNDFYNFNEFELSNKIEQYFLQINDSPNYSILCFLDYSPNTEPKNMIISRTEPMSYTEIKQHVEKAKTDKYPRVKIEEFKSLSDKLLLKLAPYLF